MPDTLQPPASRPLTRIEEELDGLARFRFTDLFTHRPSEGVCACGAKHFNWGSDCNSCRGVL